MAGNKTYEELQEALFGGLVEILRVCQEEKIRFFLGGETLLGAYLKEDFLPWSYKAVLLMPREDYEVFRILLSTGNMLSRLYALQDHTTDGRYPEGFLRMRERFTLVEIPSEVEQGLEDKGVAVEIRPLDPSRTGKMTRLARLRLQVERNERRIALKLAPAELKKKMAGPFSRLISRLTSEKSLLKRRKALERKMAPKDGSLPEAWLDLYSDSVFRDSVYPREMMEGDRTLSFHGREFPVPQDIEGYLRLVYGDYRNRDWEAMPDESLLPTKIVAHMDFRLGRGKKEEDL